jgi:uncharacterized protein YuzE
MIRLTKHAQEAVDVRNIALAWIEAVVASSDFVEADPRHPERKRSYKTITEHGGRILRVVHRAEGDDIVIITVHFRSRSTAMIKTSYDPEVDAMFVWFGPGGIKSAGTEEVSPGMMLDFDSDGRVIGIEVLDVSERMTRPKAAA